MRVVFVTTGRLIDDPVLRFPPQILSAWYSFSNSESRIVRSWA